MRLGLAIRKGWNARTNSAYRYVPIRPGKAKSDDLTAFYAYVIDNDPARKVITLQVTGMTHKTFSNGMYNEIAVIPYAAFSRIRKISDAAQAVPPPQNTTRPTSVDQLGYWNAWPYHTMVEVKLA